MSKISSQIAKSSHWHVMDMWGFKDQSECWTSRQMSHLCQRLRQMKGYKKPGGKKAFGWFIIQASAKKTKSKFIDSQCQKYGQTFPEFPKWIQTTWEFLSRGHFTHPWLIFLGIWILCNYLTFKMIKKLRPYNAYYRSQSPW